MARPLTPSSVSRRSFLEGTAALGVASIFGSSILATGAKAQTAAANANVLSASHWGLFRAKVEGGIFKEIKPFEGDKRPSKILPGVLDAVYSPTRIKYPMVRAGYLKDGPKSDRSKRGADEYVRVTWEKALDLIADEMKRVATEYGPSSIFVGSYGWHSPGKLHNSVTCLQRMASFLGECTMHTGTYSSGATRIILPHVTGRMEHLQPQTSWPVLIANTEIAVMWGADLLVTNDICDNLTTHECYEWFEAFKKKGTKVICIDPVRTASAKYFNAEWIAPRPNTDVALMLGIAHTLMAEKLHDAKFLETYTTGFDQFAAYLKGEKDQTPKTAEWAAKIAGLDAALIKRLAHDFAKNRTMLMGGLSLQRGHHGEQTHWMMITLASMLGQIGLPGGGFGMSYHVDDGGVPATNGPALPGLSSKPATPGQPLAVEKTKAGQTPPSKAIPCARIVDMLENPGKTIDFNGQKVVYPDVRLVYWAGGNPFMHHQDRNRMLKAYQKIETFIVNECQWTASARHADIVLPATTTCERDDIVDHGYYTNSGIIPMKKIVEPLYEARDDYEIFRELSKRLGREKEYTEGKSQMDWIKSFYDQAAKQAAAKKLPMPSFDEFWNKNEPVFFPITQEGRDFIANKEFRDDPLLSALPTPSGKIEIFSKNIDKMGYDDCKGHPTWMEPAEWLGGKTVDKYPLHVISSHSSMRLHSQLCGTVLRKQYAVAEREPCLINPKDAAARGIKAGDVVRVFNGRGQMLAGAVLTDDIREGVVRVCEGGWYDPAEPGKAGTLCKYGDVNVLTLDIGTSKLAQSNIAHTVTAQMEKYTGPAHAVTVFTTPKNG